MTKIELIREIEKNYRINEHLDSSLDAVARFMKAHAKDINKDVVGLLEKKLADVNDNLSNDNVHPISKERLAGQKDILMKAIALLDLVNP